MLCKRVYFERGGLLLRSLNPDYPDRTLAAGDFEGIWPVVGSYRREKGKRL
jgi:phage repressor protein C with HTH and peptisase S24 domain